MKNFIIIVPRYYPDISYGGPTLSVSNMAKKLFYLDWVYPIENWHDTNASCNKNLSEGLW